MDNDFEIQGYFWIPRRSSDRVPGTFRYKVGEGGRLDLLGTWFSKVELLSAMGKPMDEPIIVGMTEKGKLLTLSRCFHCGGNISMPGITTMSFRPSLTLIGVGIGAEPDIRFNAIRVRFSFLEDWVGLSGFDIQDDFKNYTTVVKYRIPRPVEARLASGDVIRVVVSATFPGRRFVQNEAQIKQQTFLEYVPAGDRPLSDLWTVIRRLQYFVSFGAGVTPQILQLKGRTFANREIHDSKEMFPFVDIYFAPVEPDEVSVKWTPDIALFTLADIIDDFSNVISHWLEKYELLQPVLDLYFGVQFNRRMYLQQSFLSLVHAVEVYHRLTDPGTDFPKGEHQDLVQSVVSFVDKKYRDWIREKLNYSNELSLRKRLRILLQAHSSHISKLISDHKTFLNEVVATRNYLTHYDEKLKSEALAGKELVVVIVKLEAIIQVLLLTELGFDQSFITKAVERKYQQTMNIISS